MKIALLLVLCVALPTVADELADRAARLHKSAIVVDTHVDTPSELKEKWVDLAKPGATKHVDLARLRAGNAGAIFFSIYESADATAVAGGLKASLEELDLTDRTVAAHPEALVAATSVADIRKARATGRIAILKGLEGGNLFESSLGALRQLHKLGVRYVTLTHTRTHDWADSSGPFWMHDFDPKKSVVHHGLSPFGKEVVLEMNRLGIAVDLSHVSDETITAALAISKAPVFASHSSCRNLTQMPRNLTDEQITAIGKGGGVVMINAGSAFIDNEGMKQLHAFQDEHRKELEEITLKYADDPAKRGAAIGKVYKTQKQYRTTLARYVDHLEHALKLAPGGVGLGTDFDGVDDPPIGLDDVSYYPKITEELLRRGHSEEEIRGVLGENFLKFFQRVEEVAAKSAR